MNVNQIREKAMLLAEQSAVPFENSGFDQVSSIYLATTSNVRNTFKVYHDYRKVLSVCGTGAHGYEAVLNGATKVDLFDINELQILYTLYMKTAIMFLDYDDFIRYFTAPLGEDGYCFDNFLSKKIFVKLQPYLLYEVNQVFNSIYSKFSSEDILFSKLVRLEHDFSLEYLKNAASFYNEKDYYKLQTILRQHPDIITTHSISLSNLPEQLKEKYDLIILDNILEYYDKIPSLRSPQKVDAFIKKKMSTLLSPDGEIQVAYGYGFDTTSFCEAFDIHGFESSNIESDDGSDYHFGILFDLFVGQNFDDVTQDLVKRNLLISLAKQFDGYEYSIFDGITEADGQNMVLTYRNRK